MINRVTQDIWLSTHSYLQPVAHLHALIDTASATIPNEAPSIPIWDNYTADFQEGVPLLASSAAIIDLTAAARTLALFVEKLALAPLPGKLAQETGALDSETAF